MLRDQRAQLPFTDVRTYGGRRRVAAEQSRRIEIDGNDFSEGAAEIDEQGDGCHFISKQK